MDMWRGRGQNDMTSQCAVNERGTVLHVKGAEPVFDWQSLILVCLSDLAPSRQPPITIPVLGIKAASLERGCSRLSTMLVSRQTGLGRQFVLQLVLTEQNWLIMSFSAFSLAPSCILHASMTGYSGKLCWISCSSGRAVVHSD